MKLTILADAAALILAAACTPDAPAPGATPAARSTPTVRVSAADAARITIFDVARGPGLLAQCSRGTPQATSFFRPTLEQVVAAERAVPAAVARRHLNPGPTLPLNDLAALRHGWHVDAVGLIQGTRRSIYLNYAPSRTTGERGDLPTIVCDGGPDFFGAQVDLGSGDVLHLDFNGMA